MLVALLVCLIPTTIGALALGDRDRGHGPAGAAQRARDVGAGGRGRRRRRDAAPRQDRHDHLRQPDGRRVPPGRRASTNTSSPRSRCSSSLADETPEGRSIVDARRGPLLARAREHRRRRARPVHRADPHERHRVAQTARSARARPTRSCAGSRSTTATSRPTSPASSKAIAQGGGTPLVVAEGTHVLGVIHLKDTVKTGIAERFAEMRAIGIRTVMITGDNPLTAAAIAEGGRRRRLHGRGDTRGQARPHPRRAGRRMPRRHDRRRHERRARARAGRRRRRHEHRHAGRQRGRQHGRPRLRSDEAHGHRRDRQADADHPRLAHDVLDRERRGEVLRDHPRDVRRRVPRS